MPSSRGPSRGLWPAQFSHGYSRNTGQNETLPLDDVARVQKQWFSAGDSLLTLGIASRGPENNTIDICRKEWDTARKLQAFAITCHIGTHPITSDGERRDHYLAHKVNGIDVLDQAKLLGPDVLLVHATWSSDRNVERLAATRTPVSLSPYHGAAHRLRRHPGRSVPEIRRSESAAMSGRHHPAVPAMPTCSRS